MNTPRLRRWWSTLGTSSRLATRQSQRRHSSLRVFRVALAVFSVGLLTYFSPSQRPYSITDLRVGSVAPERINAPLPFYVRKSPEELNDERLAAERAIPTVLTHDAHSGAMQLAYLDSVYDVLLPSLRMQMPDSLKQRRLQRELPDVVGSLSEAALRQLDAAVADLDPTSLEGFVAASKQVLSDIYATGILGTRDGPLRRVTRQIRIGDDELSIEAIHDEQSLRRGELLPLIEGYRPLIQGGSAEAIHELLSLFLVPNLVVDVEQTQRLRDEARRSVASIKRRYLQDEMIIDQNTKVEQQHVDALESLATHLAEEKRKDETTRLLQTVAAASIAAFFLVVLGYHLATREPEIYYSAGLLLLLTIVGLTTAGTAAYIQTNDIQTYFAPTPLAAMLLTILLTPQVALVVCLLLALFIGSLFGDFYVALILALTAAVAVFSVRHVRHRNQFYRAMILLPASYAVLITAADVLRFVPHEQIYGHVLPGIFIGIAAPIVIQGLLPIFESIFNVTTDITLLELSDLNRPLLRELSIRAPGTYTHSLIMANLSEAAAQSISASPLLARVGCYYHDIGKMLKPEYFSENQGLRGGRNPHDHLTPSMSVLIIDSHVKDGIDLAEENGLPQAIIDLIPEHHGTTVMEYFYNRAIELGVENVRRDDFRYDGPKPQTKEGGILMLADSVESAVRTLSERTPSRVRQLVRRIVQQKFTAGELDECPLTLRDLHAIEDAFIPVLMGTLHGRLEYPWQKQAQRKERRSGGANPSTLAGRPS
ncbi:MAG: HDIG domain-containing protein [Gemmatimonadetes bacterium]|nr:HDIG domain-containing protein [Gemmatimonadota bacterium]